MKTSHRIWLVILVYGTVIAAFLWTFEAKIGASQKQALEAQAQAASAWLEYMAATNRLATKTEQRIICPNCKGSWRVVP